MTGCHTPVMVEAVLTWLAVRPGGVYVDGTVGGGGHASAILAALQGRGRLIGMDKDRAAIARSAERLAAWRDQVVLVHGNYADMRRILSEQGVNEVDGVLLDLGLSSDQLADPSRGFSFSSSGPLDMRMDTSQPMTAADMLASLSEDELADVLRRYGDEPDARRIAHSIVKERNRRLITRTEQVVEIIARAKRRRSRSLHPATQTFQALRIAVNRELENLEKGLEAGLSVLRSGGRMVVISFHSLEDRIVKQTFLAHAGKWESLPQGGRIRQGRDPAVRLLMRKPVRPTADEVVRNPRARSALLRAVERL